MNEMSQPLLSVCIVTLNSRHEYLSRLLDILQNFIELAGSPFLEIECDRPQDRVELIIEADDGELTIGEKRNRCLDRAKGLFVCFLDDDDLVPPQYCLSIPEALAANPDIDALGFKLEWYIDDRFIATWKLRARPTMHEAQDSVTGCCHLMPIRTEIARQVRFINANESEDTTYSLAVHKLIKKEVFIPEVLYYYYKRTNKPETIINAKAQAKTAKKQRRSAVAL